MWVEDPGRPGRQRLYEVVDEPYGEDRVEAYARLISRHEHEVVGQPGVVAIARLYAPKEANGLVDYDELEEEWFPPSPKNRGLPRLHLVAMREVPPETREWTVSKCERPARGRWEGGGQPQ